MTQPNRKLAQAARRQADQTTARLADIATGRPLVTDVATVVGRTVTVAWRGGAQEAAGVLAAYTPAAGDRVLCVVDEKGQLFVIGHIT